jgi:hypothetical protein
MADVNPQVALNVVPPDPQGGLKTLSSIMGLGSQGLAIRGQQSQNQSLAAKATIDQQTAKENQALAGLMSDPIKAGIVNQDGVPTKDAQTIIMRAAPTTGSAHTSALLDAATKKVGYNTAVNSLLTQDRTELANGIAGVTARAQSPDDITDAVDQIVASKKGTPEYGNYQTIASTMKQAITHLAKQNSGTNPAPPGKEPWRVGAANIASSMGGGLPTAQNTGAGVVNRDPILGTLSQPPGAPTGSPINPTPPQVAGATAGVVGGVGADRDRANQVSAAVGPANQTVTITKEIDDLADQVHSGKISQAISKAAAAVGMDSTTYARQLLEKDLGRLKATASAGAGTDQRQATVLSGFPDATSDNQTIHTAMDYTRGVARQDLARGNLLNQVRSKDPNVRGFQHADDVLTGNTDPLMHEFNALKTPAERIGFYKRNFSDPQKAQEFRDKVAGMGHLNVIGQ